MEWTIDGESTFKTYIGALITVVIMSIVLAYSAKEFVDMYSYANPDIKTSTTKIDLNDPE